jgi:hypothetical protein
VTRVTEPMRRVFAQVTGWPAPGSQRRASSPQPGKYPIRTHVRRPTRPPLLYFAAVPAVRFVRISPLTSGAKRARTADLLHAIWRQHVHPRPSLQVTVLPRPLESARVRVSCCTSVLYRSIRAAPPVVAPDEALTSVKPLRQVTDAPSGVHPVKQALEVGPRHSPAASPNPSPDRSLARRQTPSRAHRGLDRNFRFCR